MANKKKPFLSSFFSRLAQDEKTAERIRNKDMVRQISELPEDIRKGFDVGYENFKNNNLDMDHLYNSYGIEDMGQKGVDALAADPYKDGNALTLIKGYAGAHPFKTMAGAGLGLMNLGGLTDNDYYGGQLAGLAAGGFGSALLGGGFSPMITMAGGALGSLFDKLRQKQADSQKAQQYYPR